MHIVWLGHSCFKLTEKEFTMIIDPFDQKIMVKPPIIKKADYILLTSRDLIDPRKYKESFVISGPGEYERKGVFVQGIGKNSTHTIYFIKWGGISMAHLGNIRSDISQEDLETIEEVDILMIPIGGHQVFDAKKGADLIQEIEPRVVIPMSYKIPGLKIKADGLETFAREVGIKDQEAQEKIKITRKDLPSEETHFVILKKQ